MNKFIFIGAAVAVLAMAADLPAGAFPTSRANISAYDIGSLSYSDPDSSPAKFTTQAQVSAAASSASD